MDYWISNNQTEYARVSSKADSCLFKCKHKTLYGKLINKIMSYV